MAVDWRLSPRAGPQTRRACRRPLWPRGASASLGGPDRTVRAWAKPSSCGGDPGRAPQMVCRALVLTQVPVPLPHIRQLRDRRVPFALQPSLALRTSEDIGRPPPSYQPSPPLFLSLAPSLPHHQPLRSLLSRPHPSMPKRTRAEQSADEGEETPPPPKSPPRAPTEDSPATARPRRVHKRTVSMPPARMPSVLTPVVSQVSRRLVAEDPEDPQDPPAASPAPQKKQKTAAATVSDFVCSAVLMFTRLPP